MQAVTMPAAERLASQRAAFLQHPMPSLQQRRADLKRLKQAILAHRTEFEAALQADFGHRSSHETTIMELMTLVHGIHYLHRNLRRWMRPEKRQVALHFLPARSYVLYQPLGVIGVMSPWNYPVSLALMPLATALAAGNRVMIKPSEFTPATSALLETMLGELFSPDQVAVVQGDANVGAAFAALPFDHLVFTGSTRVGKAVMKAASEHLVPLTLELGGKSPTVLAPGQADFAAASVAYGKLANAGQTCIAPDYLLLHEADRETFVAAYDAAVRRFYPQGAASPDYSAIINDHHCQRLQALLEDARSKGARVIEVGVPQAGFKPHTLPPTLVLDVTDDMQIMQEEIFGPLLPVRTYREFDEVIHYINAHDRPLALYYFGPADARRERLLAQTRSGNVTLNNTLLHYAQDDLPFGGVGPSGMGAYHGMEGFRALSHARGVFEQGRWNPGRLLHPPFGRVATWLIRFLLR